MRLYAANTAAAGRPCFAALVLKSYLVNFSFKEVILTVTAGVVPRNPPATIEKVGGGVPIRSSFDILGEAGHMCVPLFVGQDGQGAAGGGSSSSSETSGGSSSRGEGDGQPVAAGMTCRFGIGHAVWVVGVSPDGGDEIWCLLLLLALLITPCCTMAPQTRALDGDGVLQRTGGVVFGSEFREYLHGRCRRLSPLLFYYIHIP